MYICNGAIEFLPNLSAFIWSEMAIQLIRSHDTDAFILTPGVQSYALVSNILLLQSLHILSLAETRKLFYVAGDMSLWSFIWVKKVSQKFVKIKMETFVLLCSGVARVPTARGGS